MKTLREEDPRKVPLSDCFFDRFCLGPTSFEEILDGAHRKPAKAVDVAGTDTFRNALLPGFGRGADRTVDLFAPNIQRGHDHGLPYYFALRQILRLDPEPNIATETITVLHADLFVADRTDPFAVVKFSLVEIDPPVGPFAGNRPSSRLLGETEGNQSGSHRRLPRSAPLRRSHSRSRTCPT